MAAKKPSTVAVPRLTRQDRAMLVTLFLDDRYDLTEKEAFRKQFPDLWRAPDTGAIRGHYRDALAARRRLRTLSDAELLGEVSTQIQFREFLAAKFERLRIEENKQLEHAQRGVRQIEQQQENARRRGKDQHKEVVERKRIVQEWTAPIRKKYPKRTMSQIARDLLLSREFAKLNSNFYPKSDPKSPNLPSHATIRRYLRG